MRTTRRHPYASAFAALVTLAVPAILAACANDATRSLEPSLPKALASVQPDLGNCGNLAPPAGSTLVFHAYARGVQIYRWTGTSWEFVAPEAVLYQDDGENGVLATHFAGPTWKSHSGSTVVGVVTQRCTPDPDAIPWLLLKATSEGPGIFQGVTFIQRVNTVGGLAPTEPGEVVGEEAEVPYTADYFFYRG